MKLEIELVPKTAWYTNLRTKISKQKWDEIRFETYSRYNHCCGICSVKDRLNCHEIWEYDDVNHIQKLKGFIALCKDCHMIKHIGFAQLQARKGLLDMNKLIDHFLKVNDVTKDFFTEYYNNVSKIWIERSKFEWVTDLGAWKNWVCEVNSK